MSQRGGSVVNWPDLHNSGAIYSPMIPDGAPRRGWWRWRCSRGCGGSGCRADRGALSSMTAAHTSSDPRRPSYPADPAGPGGARVYPVRDGDRDGGGPLGRRGLVLLGASACAEPAARGVAAGAGGCIRPSTSMSTGLFEAGQDLARRTAANRLPGDDEVIWDPHHEVDCRRLGCSFGGFAGRTARAWPASIRYRDQLQGVRRRSVGLTSIDDSRSPSRPFSWIPTRMASSPSRPEEGVHPRPSRNTRPADPGGLHPRGRGHMGRGDGADAPRLRRRDEPRWPPDPGVHYGALHRRSGSPLWRRAAGLHRGADVGEERAPAARADARPGRDAARVHPLRSHPGRGGAGHRDRSRGPSAS